MSYLFTSESVSEGHPDKVSDQISDGILDNFLAFDPNSKVACETLVTTGQVVLSGEVTSSTYIDVQNVAREIIKDIGYNNDLYKFSGESCAVMSLIHEQSEDILRGVERDIKEDQGAGDQGIMFGYACNETENGIPLTLDIANKLLFELSRLRRSKTIPYLRPDSKSQVTIEYDENDNPLRIDTIVISTQHDEFDSDDKKMLDKIRKDIIEVLIPEVKKCYPASIQKLFNNNIKYHVNPTGKFVIGGPHGDTGLTGRKIIIDTYGGRGAHGGGAFSGKDPSKVDRSAAYAARHISKNLVKAGVSNEILIQVGYAIGVAEPVSLNVNTCGKSKLNISDSKLSNIVNEIFDLKPHSIESRFNLRDPIYLETASYGHMGRKSEKKTKTFNSKYSGVKKIEVELFPWEKLEYVEQIIKSLKL
ncbi:MAG: methionine adenosyltransferase [Bacteroidetes bacterium]|nr:methionine adenosyltransferase [Flavobacteriaceae bacterium]MDA0885037.1 methionine adenosyltransferase [Bacteroidota bacterium]